MSETLIKRGMGWLPNYPDFRDYTVEQDTVSTRLQALGQKDSIKAMLSKTGVPKAKKGTSGIVLPPMVDLRPWCSPIENQGSIGSCTAHAGVGMVEYFERRAFGKHIDASRLFLYKTTRNLMQVKGDTGAFLRNTMGALVLFGVPPEDYWPYKTEDFEQEPPAFCYAFAQNFQAISYFCLDPAGTDKQVLLHRIKDFLARGLPSIFGFTVYSSISQSEKTGRIPYPSPGDRIVGGHAVMAVGYDDSLEIVNTAGGIGTTGALLLRNSWGEGWGEGGYGWLPYDYILKGLAEDWWCLLKNEWVDTGQFKT